MSLIFTDYNGGTDNLAVCLAPPNWRTPPQISPEFPFTDIERAIIGKESRRSYGLTKRHTFSYTPVFRDEFDATAFRLGLNRLKGEQIAVPLWTDFVTTAASLGASGTSVAVVDAPTRSGSHWIFVADDRRTFEIVTVTGGVGSSPITFAARTGLVWPAGSRLYPLLFGKFSERPQLESITPSRVEGALKFIENSAIDEKISAPAVTIPTVGSHISDFASYKLWTLEPDWVRPIDTTEADILYSQIGFTREEQQYEYLNWNRRGLEMQFTCRTRDDIAFVEAFFASRLGPVREFFIPTFRNDLKLAADIGIGDDVLTIEDSRYEDAAYDDHPGSAFIALLGNDGVVRPQRVLEVDGNDLTIEDAIIVALPRATTRLCFLMLVRFADTKIEWDYSTPGRAVAKIKFLEVPDEYAEPRPDLPTWAYLFHFQEALANGFFTNWYFTSFENSIDFGGNTYLVAPFMLGEREVTLDLSDNCELKSWGLFAGNPLNRFLPYTLNADLVCTITRVNSAAPNDGSARQLFTGKVTELDTTGPEWTATLRDPVAVLLDRQYPRMLFQPADNWIQFSPPTQLDETDWKVTGVIASISDTTVTVTGTSNATDYFSGGWFQTGIGALQELRTILKSTLASGVQTLTIDRPLLFAVVGHNIGMFPGYDGSREQCDAKFDNNINFGGHEFMPDTNPSIAAADIMTPSGGKK